MVLGSPWQLIKMRNPSSLTVTRTVTPTLWTVAPCGAGIPCTARKGTRNHGPMSARTEMATSLVTRTAINIVTGSVRNLKRAITDMVQIGLTGDGKTTTVSPALMANARDHVGMIVHPTATKQSKDVE